MIGQKTLKSTIDRFIEQENFPNFLIITGSKGSGRKELCRYINENFNALWCLESDCKIDTIRNAINDAYRVKSRTCYVFNDVDNMSEPAKNALLKVTEEPPNDAHFIMTMLDENNTLETIRSRANIIHMEPYSMEELEKFADRSSATEKEWSILKELCTTPGEIETLLSIGCEDFYSYVQKVVENIATTSGANAFKIANNLALKADSDGYDVQLFLKAFISICLSNMKEGDNEDRHHYGSGISITSRYLQECDIVSLSKKMLVDSWILAIRKEWM